MQRFIAALAAGLVAGAALTGWVFAAGYDVAANCTVAPLQFVFDGKSVTPQVANGNPAGFICDGTSYVPLRFMAESLGRQVAWDGSTDTITVTTPGGTAPASSGPTVQAATSATLGQILVDANGMSLYRLTQDTNGTSTCTGGCAAVWPPLTVTGTPTLAAGVSGTLGTTTRSDGSLQVTYNGMPLYRYGGDSKPGDTNGQGVGGVWFVVRVGQMQNAAGGSSSGGSGGGAGGYGY